MNTMLNLTNLPYQNNRPSFMTPAELATTHLDQAIPGIGVFLSWMIIGGAVVLFFIGMELRKRAKQKERRGRRKRLVQWL